MHETDCEFSIMPSLTVALIISHGTKYWVSLVVLTNYHETQKLESRYISYDLS